MEFSKVVDMIADFMEEERVIAFLESQGYETLHASPGYSNHLHSESSMGRIDFIYVGGETSRRLLGGSGTTLRFGHRDLPVPRAGPPGDGRYSSSSATRGDRSGRGAGLFREGRADREVR